MTDRQEAKLNMYVRVLEACQQYLSLFSHIPAMVEVVKQLETLIAEIRKMAENQAKKTTHPITEEKSIALDLLVEQAIKIAKVVYIFAFMNKDRILAARVNVNKSMFYNAHNNDVVTLANIIATEAETYAEDIKAYGIDPIEIDNLKNLISQFTALMQKPKVTAEERKVVTTNLKALYAATDSLLYDLLDSYILLFKSSTPDFYLQYKAARNLIIARKRD